MKLLLHPPRRGVDPVLTAPIINEHLRASSIGAMVLPPMLGLSCGQFMIQLKVDQGGNTAVDDDHEGNQKNDDCDPKYQKKEDLHRFKAQTAHYVGLFGWVTALCDAPAVVERFRVRIWGHRVRASYPERCSCGRRRHDGIGRFGSTDLRRSSLRIVLLWN